MINLGGQSTPNNPVEIMRKAKEERLLREKFKHQQAAVLVIQVRSLSYNCTSQLLSPY
jgi:hypothetical protein